MMRSGPFFALRFVTLTGALALGALSIWIVAAEALSPRLPPFPQDDTEARMFWSSRSWTQAAALTGMVRGDLWTTAAVAEFAPVIDPDVNSIQSTFVRIKELAPAAATYAAKLSPHDSRNWLVLAFFAQLPNNLSRVSVADALKLSYYTGSGNFSLTPVRAQIALQPATIADDEIKTFVSLEIQQFAAKAPSQIAKLGPAYAGAQGDGRKVIEAAITAVNPALLNTLKKSLEWRG